MARSVELKKVPLPDFPLPDRQPQISGDEYEQRIKAALNRAARAGLDFLVVYGDREHFANLDYLTGHDPRFEEALLVLSTTGSTPVLILGKEGFGYSELSPVNLERRLYPTFGLLGQDRSEAPRLEPILSDCGMKRGSRIGLVGWKYVTPLESDDPDHWLEVPSFISDSLRTIAGDSDLVVNATVIFMNPVDGLRSLNSPNQLAVFEFAAAHCSQSIRKAIEGLRPGITELEGVQNMGLTGLPLSAHVMFSTGPRAHLGLPSPTIRVVERGDPFFVALGLRGGLSARAGFVVGSEMELPSDAADYLDRLVKPYFAAVAAWYECVGIGVTGGELQRVVDESLAGHNIDTPLNPGHLIHLDEWVHSPIYPDSKLSLQSGMLIQCDIIPVVEPRYNTTNAEDTIALADYATREQLSRNYPDMWKRIEARRAFMRDGLGIRLKPEVLPFSSLPGIVQPFALSPEMMMVSVVD